MNAPHPARPAGKDAHSTAHFRRQRLTALANIPLVLFFLFVIITRAGADHETMHAFLAQVPVAAALLALLASALWHMHLGMQTIIEDYVHHDALKFFALALNLLFPLGIGLLCVLSVLRIFLNG